MKGERPRGKTARNHAWREGGGRILNPADSGSQRENEIIAWFLVIARARRLAVKLNPGGYRTNGAQGIKHPWKEDRTDDEGFG